MDLLDQRCGRLLLTCVLTLATCHRVQPTEGSTFRSDRGNAVVASGLATTCGGGACCGALFQTAAIPKEIVDQLTVTANTLNFTSSAERMMDDPFVSMKVPTSATDSNEQTSPFLADLMYVANFNSSSSSVRMSFVDEGENLGPAIWSYVDVTVLPLITGGSEIYIFVLSGREETQEDSNGYNYDLVQRLWSSVDIVPSYLIKPLSLVIGCTGHEAQYSPWVKTTVDSLTYQQQDGIDPRLLSVVAPDASRTDFGSCGNACCMTNTSFFGMDVDNLVQYTTTLVNQTAGLSFLYMDNVSGFVPVSTTSYIARAIYTEQVPRGYIPSSLVLNMEVTAVIGAVNTSGSSLHLFSLCVLGADETRVCFADDGLNYAVQHNLTAALMARVGVANTTILFGCAPTVGSPAASAGAVPGGSAASNVAGVVCAVVLLVAVTTWIKHASLRHPHTAAAPTRLLYIVVLSMLVTLVDRHASGWAPHDLPDGTHVYALNYHPVLMTVGMVMLLTEGVLAAPTSKTDPTDSHAKLVHGLVQFLALVVVAAGLACVVSDRAVRRQDSGAMHLTSAHAWLGVVVVCLLVGQLFAAVYVYTCANFRVRHVFAAYHRLFGFITYFTALAAVMTGLSQFGHYIAIQRDGACLDAAFPSTSCYDTVFSIMIFLVWGVAATAFASKLSETTRRSATYTDI